MNVMDRPDDGSWDDAARLAIFRLVPTPLRNDRRFARDAFHGEVVVRARSPEDAREVASEAARAAGDGGAEPGGDEDSPFRDDTLYTVIEITGVDFLCSGQRGLIAGRFAAKPSLAG
jgi:hypothetical protein